MINALINKLNTSYKLNEGINSILIHNLDLYREIYFDTEDSFTFSLDNVAISFTSIYVIKNIYDIDLNDKKNVTYLVKYLSKRINKSYMDEFTNIVLKLKDLLDKLNDENEYNINYDLEINYEKLLSLFDVSFSINEDYISKLLEFFINVNKISSNKLFITFDLFNKLSKNEFDKINAELKSIKITLFDISYIEKNTINPENFLLIDDDLCII